MVSERGVSNIIRTNIPDTFFTYIDIQKWVGHCVIGLREKKQILCSIIIILQIVRTFCSMVFIFVFYTFARLKRRLVGGLWVQK
jgi:hypothetical protein